MGNKISFCSFWYPSYFVFLFPNKKISKNIHLSLIAAFLATISPWLIHYSRIALEVNTGFFLSLLGTWLFLKGKEKGSCYLLSSISFALAFWTYYANKLWVLLFGIYLIIFIIKLYGKITKWFIVSLLIFAFLITPYISLYFSGNILSRQYGISIFNNQEENNKNAMLLVEDFNRGNVFAKIIHNRRWIFFNSFANGYLYIINPTFLFSQDNANQMSKIRLLYLWQIPLILIAIFNFRKRNKWFFFIFFWLVIGYIPGALTILPAFDRRILINSFPLILLTSIGIDTLIINLKRMKLSICNLFLLFILSIIFFSFYSFIHFYFIHGQTAVINLWGNGMKELVKTGSRQKEKYQSIIVSNRFDSPWIYFLFYEKYSPSKYIEKGGTVSGDFREERNNFEKYYFKNIFPDNLRKDTLYVWTADEEFACMEIKNKIYRSDGKLFALIGSVDSSKGECLTQP